jgi:hypothetical protein
MSEITVTLTYEEFMFVTVATAVAIRKSQARFSEEEASMATEIERKFKAAFADRAFLIPVSGEQNGETT